MAELESVELEAWNWIAKVNERITFIRLNVLDGRDITEGDYDLLKVLFRAYHNGEHPLFKTKLEGIAESSVQNTLFSDTKSSTMIVNCGGMMFAPMANEPIKKE